MISGMEKNMEGNLPESLDELCDYIVKYADDIYVREQINGKWGSYSLTEMPTILALKHSMRFIKEGRVPHRIIRNEENCV